MFQKTDVSKPDDVKALVERAVNEFGRLDLALNNAGTDGQQVPLHEQDIEKASFLFDVNIKGVFYCMKYEIEQMLKTGGGAIVNTSSIFGSQRLSRLVAVHGHEARRHRHDQSGGTGLRQEEHPSKCGRPWPGRNATAGERHRRRPPQLRRLRPDGADRPARRDRRCRGLVAVRRGPVRHRPHASCRWWRLLAVTDDTVREVYRGDERCTEQPGLFTPVKVGPLELPNRIVMSPMTRIRAGEGCVPSERMVRYYSQRASAGLIITEGTHPSPMGRGYTYPPGLHTEEQAAGWRKVTDAVHAAGGRIFVQLMHAGRVSHSSLLPDHALPVAPSAIAISGEIHTFDGKVPFETPRALETGEISAVVEEYRRAAELSITAGFDGVELHAATGYLPNQFQVTGSNRRTDAYGG